MAKHDSNWADRRAKVLFRRLIKALGGKCARCKTRSRLEVDHRFGRNWDVAAYSKLQRVYRYRAEARKGLLQPLCRKCNASKGDAYEKQDSKTTVEAV